MWLAVLCNPSSSEQQETPMCGLLDGGTDLVEDVSRSSSEQQETPMCGLLDGGTDLVEDVSRLVTSCHVSRHLIHVADVVLWKYLYHEMNCEQSRARIMVYVSNSTSGGNESKTHRWWRHKLVCFESCTDVLCQVLHLFGSAYHIIIHSFQTEKCNNQSAQDCV